MRNAGLQFAHCAYLIFAGYNPVGNVKNAGSVFVLLDKIVGQPAPRLPDDSNFSDDFRSFVETWYR